MTRPRQLLPGCFYEMTRACLDRMFLMRPDWETNNAYIYCLGEAAERFGIKVLMPMAESNHEHVEFFDPDGRASEFMQHFHKNFARCQNAYLGRSGYLWDAQEPCLVRLLDADTVIAKMVYAAANPVKDHLVKYAHQWPGVSGYNALKNNETLRATRPRFFRSDGRMPKTVELRLTIPEELGISREEVVARVIAGVREVEESAAAELAKKGGHVLGRREVMRQSWKDKPKSEAPRSVIRPRFAGRRDVLRVALLAYREFLAAYRDARARLLARLPTSFPQGTYWLARFAAVPIAG